MTIFTTRVVGSTSTATGKVLDLVALLRVDSLPTLELESGSCPQAAIDAATNASAVAPAVIQSVTP